MEQNTGQINVPGTYKDPESGEVLSVVMAAGADALVRLGWELIDVEPSKEEVKPQKAVDAK